MRDKLKKDFEFLLAVTASCVTEEQMIVAKRLGFLYFNKYWKYRNVCGIKNILKEHMFLVFGSCYKYYWVVYKRRKLNFKQPLIDKGCNL
jgi:hypothetical protein